MFVFAVYCKIKCTISKYLVGHLAIDTTRQTSVRRCVTRGPHRPQLVVTLAWALLYPELCALCGVTHARLAAKVFAVLCPWAISCTDVSLKQTIKLYYDTRHVVHYYFSGGNISVKCNFDVM